MSHSELYVEMLNVPRIVNFTSVLSSSKLNLNMNGSADNGIKILELVVLLLIEVLAAEKVPIPVGDFPTQRPGKERAQTPTSELNEIYFSPPRSDRVREKKRRKSSPRRYSSSDSLIELQAEPSRRRGKDRRHGRRRSPECSRSYDSDSPKVWTAP
jgi:hypothetical protein